MTRHDDDKFWRKAVSLTNVGSHVHQRPYLHAHFLLMAP